MKAAIFLIPFVFLQTGCADNNPSVFGAKANEQRVRIQDQTIYHADMTVVEPVSLDNVTLAEAIEIVNGAKKTECMPVITVAFDERIINDFARNPEKQLSDMKNARLSIHAAYVNLAYLVSDILTQIKDENGQLYGCLYADQKIEILPRNYFSITVLYYSECPHFKTMTLDLFLKLFKMAFEDRDLKPKLYLDVNDAAMKTALLNHQLFFPDKPITRYEAIVELKKQLNLNCYLDDNGNLVLEPKI